MLQLHRTRTLWLPVLATALLAPASSIAQEFSESDTREIGSYVLNEAGLAKYAAATRNLGEITDQLPDNCDDEEDVQSLDDAAARLDAIPDVRAAIESAGMASREYVLFSFSLFQNGMAAWVLSQPGGTLPPDTSMANVEFYRAHEASLQELGSLTQPGDCEDTYEEGEYDEDEDN
jgi:hypothetical protein